MKGCILVVRQQLEKTAANKDYVEILCSNCRTYFPISRYLPG
ncbi:hypothetical protein [Paraflavitalea devenefica]|nr:hypothetical protein [Paraflavitalea devenefica]